MDRRSRFRVGVQMTGPCFTNFSVEKQTALLERLSTLLIRLTSLYIIRIVEVGPPARAGLQGEASVPAWIALAGGSLTVDGAWLESAGGSWHCDHWVSTVARFFSAITDLVARGREALVGSTCCT